MKKFLIYGHDSNASFIETRNENLSKDAEGNLKHEVWIVTSEIKAGKDWREEIFNDYQLDKKFEINCLDSLSY